MSLLPRAALHRDREHLFPVYHNYISKIWQILIFYKKI
jgi:hypothetical protein